MKCKALIKKTRNSAYEAGDIVRAEAIDFEFTEVEKAWFEVVELEGDVEELNRSLVADIAAGLPYGAKRFGRKQIVTTRLVVPEELAPCRYFLDDANQIRDKRYD